MRPMLLLLAVVCLSAAEADPLRQPIEEGVRALMLAQRPDGGWSDSDAVAEVASIVRVTSIPPPPSEPPPPAAAENRYRSSAPGFCLAAEVLWLSRELVPEAAVAAAKAQDLAARALLADPERPPGLMESIAFLRAERARGVEPDGAKVREAIRISRRIVDAAFTEGTIGGTFLGLIDLERRDRIDLQLTWHAIGLMPSHPHDWIDVRWASRPRVSRYQPIVSEPLIDRTRKIEPLQPFIDGSVFAAALTMVDDETLAWLRPICESEDPASMDGDRALAYLSVFAQRRADAPDAWWRSCMARWTQAYLGIATRREIPGGAVLEWKPANTPLVFGNGFALRWLLACRRLDERARQAKLHDIWVATHIDGSLVALKTSQTPDGGWADGADGSDTTALAGLAFLGVGYDHKTPNKYRTTMRTCIEAVLQIDSRVGTTRDRAWRTMMLAEAYAMTNDPALRVPAQQRLDDLWQDRLPDGGWAAQAGGTMDWPASVAAIMAMRSAYGGGLKVRMDEMAPWWTSQAGDGAGDPLEVLAWKAVAGVFLGRTVKERSDAIGRRLVARLATEEPTPLVNWASTLAIFQLGGDAWDAWQARLKAMPPPAPHPAEQAVRLLADEVIYRYVQVRRLE